MIYRNTKLVEFLLYLYKNEIIVCVVTHYCVLHFSRELNSFLLELIQGQ